MESENRAVSHCEILCTNLHFSSSSCQEVYRQQRVMWRINSILQLGSLIRRDELAMRPFNMYLYHMKEREREKHTSMQIFIKRVRLSRLGLCPRELFLDFTLSLTQVCTPSQALYWMHRTVWSEHGRPHNRHRVMANTIPWAFLYFLQCQIKAMT